MNRLWTKNEKEYLRQLYEECGLSLIELYSTFNSEYNRTLDGVFVKIARSKFKHTKEQTAQVKSRLNSGEKNGMYGKIGIRTGFTKLNDETTRLAAIKMSNTRKQMYKDGLLPDISGDKNPMFGKDGYLKGQTKLTNSILLERGKKLSIIRKEFWENLSQEDKDNIINILNEGAKQQRENATDEEKNITGKKKSHSLKEFWKNLSQEEKNKQIEYLSIIASKKQKDTWIELVIQEFLDKNKINYIKQYRIKRFIIDIYLTDFNAVIECQGDYWHANPIKFKNPDNYTEAQKSGVARDIRKKQFFEDNNIKNLFLWEYDIKNNRIFVENQILEYCGNKTKT